MPIERFYRRGRRQVSGDQFYIYVASWWMPVISESKNVQNHENLQNGWLLIKRDGGMEIIFEEVLWDGWGRWWYMFLTYCFGCGG